MIFLKTKNILFFVLFSFFSCKTENSNKTNIHLNEKKQAKQQISKTEPFSKKSKIPTLPLPQKISIKERINEQLVHIDISYQLDTFRLKHYNNTIVKAKEIVVNVSPKEFFPENFEAIITEIIGEKQNYSMQRFEEKAFLKKTKIKLLKADFNFDGYTDFYFEDKYGRSQNSSYEVFIYHEKKKHFVKSEELSKHSWARLEFLDDKKEIRLYNHFSASEGSKRNYIVGKSGDLKLQSKEVTARLNYKKGDRKLYRIKACYKNDIWTEDTIVLQK